MVIRFQVRTVSGESTHMTVSWHIVDLPAENCGERLRAGTNGRDDDVLDECSPHVGGLASTSSSFVKSADVTFNRRDGLTGEAKVWLDIGGEWCCFTGTSHNCHYDDAITPKDMMTSSNENIFRVTGHLCGEFPGEFPAQRPVTRSFDFSFDVRLNKVTRKMFPFDDVIMSFRVMASS